MLIIDDDNNIYLTRGDTATFDIDIKDAEGNPYSMDTNDRVIFTLRRLAGKGIPLITKTSATPEFSLATDDTSSLSFGKYKYDIFLYNQVSENLDTFIANKIFEIGEEVHDFE